MDLFSLLMRDGFSSDPFTSPLYNKKFNYPLNIIRTDNFLEYQIAAIGLDKEDIELSLENRTLTVLTKDKGLHAEGSPDTFLYRGIKGSDFKIQLLIPNEFEDENLDVKLDRGLLKIRSLRKESSKPKKIEIKVAQELLESK